MAMDGLPEGVPPSGRVPGQLLQAAPILTRRWRQYRREIGKSRAPGGPQGNQKGARRAPALGCTRDPSGVPVGPLPSILGDYGSFRVADFLYHFFGILGALLMAG